MITDHSQLQHRHEKPVQLHLNQMITQFYGMAHLLITALLINLFHVKKPIYFILIHCSFDCIRMEQSKPLADCLPYKIFYYIVDETVAVKELKQNIEGRDYCPYLLRRMQVPKNATNASVNQQLLSPDIDDDAEMECLQPDNFRIGDEVNILGHRFLLFDCDGFTRNYYENVLKTPLGDKIIVKQVHRTKKRTVIDRNLLKSRTIHIFQVFSFAFISFQCLSRNGQLTMAWVHQKIR